MSEGRLTQAELQSALLPIETPVAGAGGWPADLLAAAGLAAFTALVLSSLLSLLARPRLKKAPRTPLGSAFDDLPQDQARLEIFKRIKSEHPEASNAFREGLYDPEAAFDMEHAQSLLRQAGSGSRG